jgi:TatD DNase family protein
MTFLVDSHCHLDFQDLADDRDGILARAAAADVRLMLTISTYVTRYDTYRQLAETHPGILFTVGTHPHNVALEPEASLEQLVALSRHPRCVGIGEAGLDFFYDKAPRDVQERVFRTHIAAARETDLPLVIHARDADDLMIDILQEESGKGAFKAVLHCFSSGPELARIGLELGLYLSFSGILTFNRSFDLRNIAASAPLERVLIETDAPYLAPVPFRGKRNEPAYVAHTAVVLAETMRVSQAEIVAATTANFFRLFDKAKPAGLAVGLVA